MVPSADLPSRDLPDNLQSSWLKSVPIFSSFFIPSFTLLLTVVTVAGDSWTCLLAGSAAQDTHTDRPCHQHRRRRTCIRIVSFLPMAPGDTSPSLTQLLTRAIYFSLAPSPAQVAAAARMQRQRCRCLLTDTHGRAAVTISSMNSATEYEERRRRKRMPTRS